MCADMWAADETCVIHIFILKLEIKIFIVVVAVVVAPQSSRQIEKPARIHKWKNLTREKSDPMSL